DELDAGDAGTDHDQVLGNLGRRIGLAGGEDALAVGLGPVGDAGAAAGGHEDGVGLQLLDALVGLDDYLVGALEAPGAQHHAHALALEEVDDRPVEVAFDVGQASLDGRRIELGQVLVVETEELGAPGERHGPTGGDHGLGRDAV